MLKETHGLLLSPYWILSAYALNEEHVQLKQTANENLRLDPVIAVIIPALHKEVQHFYMLFLISSWSDCCVLLIHNMLFLVKMHCTSAVLYKQLNY